MDATTFDYADMFAGVSYPTKVVPIYTNAGIAAGVAQVNKEIRDAVTAGADEAELKVLEDKARELYEKAEQFRYVFHLRGVRRELRVNLQRDIEEKFPVKRDFLGREEYSLERVEYGQNAAWALFIERIERPDGAVIVAPTVEGIAVIRGNAPEPELDKITRGIEELTQEVSEGIEALAAEHDFLSRP